MDEFVFRTFDKDAAYKIPDIAGESQRLETDSLLSVREMPLDGMHVDPVIPGQAFEEPVLGFEDALFG
jgi:hypothetical protein